MPLTSIAVYLIHLVLLATGLATLRRLKKGGHLELVSARTWWVLAGGIGGVELLMAAPLRSPFEDFFEAYYSGAQAVVSGANVVELFQQGVHGFVNVPIVAVLLAPLALLPKNVSALLFLALGLYVSFLGWRELARIGKLDRYSAAILALLFLTNGPLWNSLKEGNTSHWALYALVICWVFLTRNAPLRAGAILALTTLFKLPLIIYVVWAALRRHFRALAAGSVVLLLLLAASVGIFGWQSHSHWYTSFIQGASQNPIGAFNVQSFAATALRLSVGASVLCDWNGHSLAPTGRRIATLFNIGLGLIVLVPCLLRAKKAGAAQAGLQAREYACVALLACCTSPLSWSHYHAWLLLAVGIWMSNSWALDFKRPFVSLFWCGVGISGLPVVWPWCAPTGALGGVYLVLISHHLIGSVLSLAAFAIAPYKDASPQTAFSS